MRISRSIFRRVRAGRQLVTLLTLGFTAFMAAISVADGARAIPSPNHDESSESRVVSEVAILAGGCFWGMQGVFQHIQGVTSVVSGYAGGEKQSAHYEQVGTGLTGHAEAVRITFDPRRVSYGQILQVFFSVAHDPTELDRQGPDSGTQYRSSVFPLNEAQERIAHEYIAQIDQAHVFSDRIVTTIEPGKTFYPAEDYHQDFMARNPNHLYIVINDLPKLKNLETLFPALYRATPVLVSDTRSSAG